jgi:hypothetical protein
MAAEQVPMVWQEIRCRVGLILEEFAFFLCLEYP